MLIFGIVVLASCSSKKDEGVEMDDLMPTSNRDYDAEKPIENSIDSTLPIKANFIDHGIKIDSLTFLNKSQFPDRFETLSSQKYAVAKDGGQFEYFRWNYSDSVKVMNAFYNWLDAFQVDVVGDEVNFQKEPMLILVGDTSLIYINQNLINANDWLRFHEETGFDKNWNYLIEQNRSGKARWYTFVEGKKVILKK